MEVRRLDSSDAALLKPLVRAYPFKPYRDYRIVSRRKQDAILEAEVMSALESPDGIVLYADGVNPSALVMRQLSWDSRFFGIPMARIDALLRSRTDVRVGLDQVLMSCHEICRAAKIWHVTTRVDVADTIAIMALEDYGFRLMEALVTYVHRPRDRRPKKVREMGVVRDYREGDSEQLMAIARESYQDFRGRFHLDPHLPDDRCDALYLEWARQCCEGRMADRLIVTESAEGQLLGFLAFRRREPASTVGGVAIYGGGLGACRRDTPGAYMGLLREGMVWAHDRGAAAEAQTQNYNIPTVRLYEGVGGKYVRAEYTFHAWFGP